MTAHVTTPKPFVFVLMPFDDKFNDVYKFGIKGAAEDVGAYAERLDEQIFQEGMLDRIYNQISKADVIVADMTGRNPNVFYEVGYAHALGKITLLLTQNANDIPFDLKHLQHTVYSGSIDVLRKELTERLRWAIAESKKRPQDTLVPQLSLRIDDIDIPPMGITDVVPEICLPSSNYREYELLFSFRNDSYEQLPEINHIYIFSNEHALWAPAFIDIVQRGSRSYRVPTSFDEITANNIDAHDGLDRQFRLDMTLPSMPPSVVETKKLIFIKNRNDDSHIHHYRLRLHIRSSILEYTFKILEPIPKPL